MTLSLKKLADALAQTAAVGTSNVHETADQIRCQGSWSSADLVELWIGLRGETEEGFVSVAIQDFDGHEIDDEDFNYAELEGQEFTIWVTKKTGPSVFFFLTLDGFRHGLTDDRVVQTARAIFVHSEFEVFESKICSCSPLSDEQQLHGSECSLLEQEVEATKLTRYLTHGIQAPRIAFWIVDHFPAKTSAVWDVWSSAASRALRVVPASEIWENDGQLNLSVSGPSSGSSKRVFTLGDKDLAHCYIQLCEVSAWLIEVPRDASIRHAYLTSELARECPLESKLWDDTLPNALNDAFDGAKAHYNAYLLEASTDMIKSFAELRKAVSAETENAISRTHDLLKGLAGSLAVSVGVIVFRLPKLFEKRVSGGDQFITQCIFGVLCGWMVFICVYSVIVNYNFLRAIKVSQSGWHSKVHSVLSSKEFNDIVVVPLKRVELTYVCASGSIVIVYFLAAITLGYLATNPFQEGDLVNEIKMEDVRVTETEKSAEANANVTVEEKIGSNENTDTKTENK
jgi:hypothetical protein